MCGLVAGVFMHVMWRLRAVGVWFVYLSCVRYWCTSTIDLGNLCVVCSCVLCVVWLLCAPVGLYAGKNVIECHGTCTVEW